MSEAKKHSMHALFEDEVQDVLRATFYGEEPTRAKPVVRRSASKPRPDHYEVICISMYKEDLERLDAKVAELKERGLRKMSRSSLIRFALDQVDLRKVPRSY